MNKYATKEELLAVKKDIEDIKNMIKDKDKLSKQEETNINSQSEPNRFVITLLLCWFLGIFGIHRFYTGHTTIGIVQLLTLGGCAIWTLIDFIIIVSGGFKDSDGNPIKHN